MNRLIEYYCGHARPGRWQLAGWLLVVAFVMFALVIDKVASTIFAVFFLTGLWLLFRGRVEKPDPWARWVLIAFAAYFLIGVLCFFAGEQTRLGEKILGRDIRFLGAVVVYFVLLAMALPQRLLRHSLAAGGLATGLLALLEVLLAEKTGYRAGGRTISIVFGHLAAALFAVNFAMALFERRGRGLSAAGALMAAMAMLLSGTRGAVLSAMVVALVAVALLLAWRGARLHRRSLVISVAFLCVLAVAAGNWVMPRVQVGAEQYAAYREAVDLLPAEPQARGCLSQREALTTLLENSRRSGRLETAIVDLPEPMSGCTDTAAIQLLNASDAEAIWLSPYRNVPVGAPGRLLLAGNGKLQLETGREWRELDAPGSAETAEIPPVEEVDRTRFRIRLQPGERLLLVPVEALAGEYAFAAMDSSIGNRIDIIGATLRQMDYSLLGQGTGAWPLAMAREAEAGRTAWRLSAYDHAHSDYLTVMLERGWLGLAGLLAVLLAPLAWSARQRREWPAAAMILLVTSISVSALTETVFNHSIGITYHAVLVLLLMTARPVSGGNHPEPE